MDDLKVIVAKNMIALRTKAGMTQMELAQKICYSDKSVSKWERADGLPDAYVLKKMGDIFSVSVDYLLSEHEDTAPLPVKKESVLQTHMITIVAIAGIWTLALLLFILFWLRESYIWLVFIYAIPISLITLLVLNSVWHKGKNNRYIVAALVIGILLSIYFTFLRYQIWQIFLLAIPADLIVFFSSKIRKLKK